LSIFAYVFALFIWLLAFLRCRRTAPLQSLSPELSFPLFFILSVHPTFILSFRYSPYGSPDQLKVYISSVWRKRAAPPNRLPEPSMTPSNRRRNGRGSNAGNTIDLAISCPNLREYYDLVSTANSASTKANVKHAKKVMAKYAAQKGVLDPIQISVERAKF